MTTKAPQPISVIIVNYNAGPSLLACVRSVLADAREVIVVDNASADQSIASLIAEFGDSPTLKVIENSRNVGFAAACNGGITSATQNFLLFLNPDCVVELGALDQMLHALVERTDAGMIGGLLCNPDGSEQRGGRRVIPTPANAILGAFWLSGIAKLILGNSRTRPLHESTLPNETVEVGAVSGACMLVRRSAIEEVGNWDESYFLHCEDLDWCMRFQQRGWKVLFCPETRIFHDQGACSRSRPIFVEWHKHKGMVRFYRKFYKSQYSRPMMVLVTTGIWFRFLLVTIYYGVKRFAPMRSN